MPFRASIVGGVVEEPIDRRGGDHRVAADLSLRSKERFEVMAIAASGDRV